MFAYEVHSKHDSAVSIHFKIKTQMTARRVCLFVLKQKTKTGQTKKIKSAAGLWNIKNVPTQDWITWESSEHKPEWKESFAEAFNAIWEKSRSYDCLEIQTETFL